ncbi:hypothetical protein FHG87_015603 [Trinorchestia longiramus]|nr:hypothetical protein FHG87_015603 [Trinorchestia longiramus]
MWQAPDAETPEGEAPDGEAVQEDVPEGEAGDESIPDLGPGEGNVVGAVGGDGDEDVDLDDMEVQGQGDGEALQLAPDEAEGGGEDQGIGSGGPTSLVGRDVPLPPADAVDPAILKAMGGDGLLEPGGGDQGDPSEHPDSGVGSIDSPKSSSPAFDLPVTSPLDELPSSSPGPPKAESPSSSGLLAKAGPVKAVHPEGGNFGDPSPEPPTATTPGPPAGPSRPPSSLRNVSSRPMSSRASRPRTARPPSARPAAPRVRERRDVPAEDLVRPSTGVSPAVLSSLIVEGGRGPARPDGAADNLAADADDDFIVADTSTSLLPTDDPLNFGASSPTAIQGGLDMDLGGLPTSQDINDEDVGEGGLLMDQILDVKKNLEDGRKAAFSPETPGHRRVNMVTDGLSDAARRKEREAIQQDVNKLAGSIQTLTKAVNPLAKMLDYLQEDLDSMQKELNDWRDENKRLRQTLRSEQSNMAACIEPLTAQLLELDAAILEQQDRISVVKCSTLKNNDRIHSLLSAVSLGSD